MKVNADYKDISGNSKEGTTILKPLERRLIMWLTPKVPSFIETYHLTLASLGMSGLILLGGWLARDDVGWLWLASGAIVAQWLTDMLDGEVGRVRKTGLVKWGFYMDHFLDYVFMSSILVSYTMLIPGVLGLVLWNLFVTAGFFVHEALSGVVLGKFSVVGYRGFAGAEMRWLVVMLNAYFIWFGTGKLGFLMQVYAVVMGLALVRVVYKRQRYFWRREMEGKKE